MIYVAIAIVVLAAISIPRTRRAGPVQRWN
jgi:hypothetical protein